MFSTSSSSGPYREEWHAALEAQLAALPDISMWKPIRNN